MIDRILKVYPYSENCKYHADLEGCRFDNGKLTLGMRAGPERNNPFTLLHEMAHLVDIDRDRVKARRNWGFIVPKDPITIISTKREIRTLAIQVIMADQLGLGFHVKDWIKAMVWMCDFLLVPGGDDDHRLLFLEDLLKEELKILTPQKIGAEWRRKQEILMEKS